MQVAPLPTLVAVKPAISNGVVFITRTVALVFLSPEVVPGLWGSWQATQVCGWTSLAVQSTVRLAVLKPLSCQAMNPCALWHLLQVGSVPSAIAVVAFACADNCHCW